jgi:hypothetical protein
VSNKQILKDNLHLIEIETFAFCNRKCWFCTNSIVNRVENEQVMPESVYLSLLDQLQEIEFSGELTFSRYNEPLSRKGIILKRIEQAKEYIPNAILRINTNGDYLTESYVDELASAGLSQLWIQQYLQNNELYNHVKIKQRIMNTLVRIGYENRFEVLCDIKDCKVEYNLLHPSMTMHIRARNFAKDGSSRGGTLNIAREYQRTAPCQQVHKNMYLDWNGTAMVCCEMRSEIPEHSDAVMGSVYDTKLWDIFCSPLYSVWRDHHDGESPKSGPCKSCRQGIKPEYE